MTAAEIIQGDVRAALRTLDDGSARCVVTSPPYWGLRDYGVPGQMGLEVTPEAYLQQMVEVFRDVRRVLADDGTLWLNLGDSYASGKQLKGIPWRLALALQADGWHLRQDIIWHKTNPMPESIRDRCTKAHEYVFLLTKQPRYYYDLEAIRLPVSERWKAGRSINVPLYGESRLKDGTKGQKTRRSYDVAKGPNRRSVWSIATKAVKGSHIAAMPEALAELCVLAGSAPDDTVLDPFSGSGTVGAVAMVHGRRYIGCELNPEYVKLSQERIQNASPLFNQVSVRKVGA